ncbi:MAG: SufS family cysteine desulfurase [Oscillospiraceae bacterium]|nr:SufS family cysteine desulfurase [Oscillospiraceae bacterium]
MNRQDFPVFAAYPELVYLDSAATAQKPRCVTDAVQRYYHEENANPLRGLYGLSVRATEAYENARDAVRDFLHAGSRREIVFTRNATESLNLIAYSYAGARLCRCDEILICISEHHSNLVPWQIVSQRTGAKLRFLECEPDGSYSPEALRAALTPHTKIFAAAQVSNVLGRLNPIRAFAEICHRNGTLIVCDGTQSVPHMPVDVQALDVDFFAFSGHKMYAPMGIGVLYGREALLREMPPFLSGGEMIESVQRESSTYAELPHKFEAGTVNVGGAAGLHAAIRYLHQIGFDAIQQHEQALTALAVSEMRQIPGVRMLGPADAADRHGIVSFTVEGVHPHDIAAVFDADGIAVRAGHHCAQPLHQFLGVPSTARMSIGLYNDEHDIERFITTLKTVRRRMGYDRTDL